LAFGLRVFVAAGLAAAAVVGAACGAGPAAPSDGHQVPVVTLPSVVQPIEVRTSDGRVLGTFTMTGSEGLPLTLTRVPVQAHWDISNTDLDFYALREANVGDQLGALVAVSTSQAGLSFLPATRTRVLWLMNAANGADYACAWATGLGAKGIWRNSRYASAAMDPDAVLPAFPSMVAVMRDPAAILRAFQLMNAAWEVGGARYSSLTYGAAAAVDVRFAWATGTCFGLLLWGGCHDYQGHFAINAADWSTDLDDAVAVVATEEATETYFDFDDLCGRDTFHSLFDPDVRPVTQVTARGADYLRFGALMARP
jgi:hypothetical protein